MDAGDSTIDALHQSGGKGKIVALAVIIIAALGAAGWFLLGLGGSRGAKDTPVAVLIVGPETDDLAGWINNRGFSAEQLSYNAAVNAGLEFEPEAAELEAVVAYADEKGFGYVAVHPPELYDYAAVSGGQVAGTPEGATIAIINVGDIAEEPRVVFGVPSKAVQHLKPADKRVGLFLGLFEQPALARFLADDVAVGDIAHLNALSDEDAIRRYRDLEKAQQSFDAIGTAWDEAAAIGKTTLTTTALGGPYEGVDAYPLEDGGILALVASPQWITEDGMRSRLEEATGRIPRYIPPDVVKATKDGQVPPADDESCGPLAEDEIRAIRVNESGDALALQRFVPDSNTDGEPSTTGAWVVQFIKMADLPKCPFAVAGYAISSRQMYDLGAAHRSGAMLMPADRLRFGIKGGERSWNYPVLTPATNAAAWVDGKLAAYSANPMYGESDITGLGFMSAMTENRLEAFFPLSTLLPKREVDDMVIVHLRTVDENRFRIVIGDRKTVQMLLLEVTFQKGPQTFLKPVDHTGDMKKQLEGLTYKTRAGLKTKILVDTLPQFEGASFDTKAQHLAYVKDGKAYVLDIDDPAADARLISGSVQVTHVRIAPDASFAILHRMVQAGEEMVSTADIVWL